MSKGARILPVYPTTPLGADLELFKKAKSKLSFDGLIQPVRAVAGSPFRVVSLRKHPDFLCDYAFVPEPSEKSVTAAMGWALGDTDDPRAITVLKSLRKIFGEGVTEVD